MRKGEVRGREEGKEEKRGGGGEEGKGKKEGGKERDEGERQR